MDQETAPALQAEPDDGADTFDALRIAYAGAQQVLTPAAQAFAEHWALHRNQIKAYQHAYPGSGEKAAKTNARHLFADHRVQAEIMRVASRWTDLSAVKLVQLEQQLGRVAFADGRLLYDADGSLKKPHEWDADTAAAVASYQEEERWEGRGEDRTKVITRKVRLRDTHAAARTLAEMKGAFERNKAPPGIQASFTINLGAGPTALGGPGQSFTVDVGGGSAVPKAKKAAKPKALTAPGIDATPKTAPIGVFQPVKRKKPKKPGKQALRARRRALQAGLAQSLKAGTRSKAATQPTDDGKTPAGAVFQPPDERDHIYNGAIDRPIEQDAGDQADAPTATTSARRRPSLFGDKA